MDRDLMLYFRAMADRKRLLVVRCLARQEEMTVTELGARLRVSQPLMSWHLRLLRRAGIVKTRRVGRRVWYSLNRAGLVGYERRVDRLLGIESEDSLPEGAPKPLVFQRAKNT